VFFKYLRDLKLKYRCDFFERNLLIHFEIGAILNFPCDLFHGGELKSLHVKDQDVGQLRQLGLDLRSGTLLALLTLVKISARRATIGELKFVVFEVGLDAFIQGALEG
jgi:hypothetical protein